MGGKPVRTILRGFLPLGAIAPLLSLFAPRAMPLRDGNAIRPDTLAGPVQFRARPRETVTALQQPELQPALSGPSSSLVATVAEYDHRLPEALHRFSFEIMPIVDGCLGPNVSSRKPQPVLARFRHVAPSEPGAPERYVLVDMRFLPVPGGVQTPARFERCLRSIQGHEMYLPSGVVGGNEMEQIIPLVLPES